MDLGQVLQDPAPWDRIRQYGCKQAVGGREWILTTSDHDALEIVTMNDRMLE